MRTRLVAAVVILLALRMPAAAHRLDEYLEATLISVEKNQLQAQIRLTPGVAVLPIVLANIDTDADGVISEAEQRAYAERVLHDLFLSIDGNRLRPRIVSTRFPELAEIKEGLGEIQIEFKADLPHNGPQRKLIFENHHQSRIGAYLVNCLLPRDPDIRVIAQNRNYTQSFYELDYVQAGAGSNRAGSGWLTAIALLLLTRVALLSRRRTMNERANLIPDLPVS